MPYVGRVADKFPIDNERPRDFQSQVESEKDPLPRSYTRSTKRRNAFSSSRDFDDDISLNAHLLAENTTGCRRFRARAGINYLSANNDVSFIEIHRSPARIRAWMKILPAVSLKERH